MSRGTAVSFAIVVALVLCGVGITTYKLWPDGSNETATEAKPVQPAEAERSEESATTLDDVVGGCDAQRAGASEAALSEAPETDWELWRGIPLPSSDEHGPFEISENGDVASCFARTPAGALFAASNFSARVLVPKETESAIEAMTLPGPGQDRRIKAQKELNLPTYAPPGELCRDTGFNVVLYTEDEAAIEFSAGCSDELLQVTVLKVVWSDDDWKLRLADDGGEGHSQRQIFSMAGLVDWEPSA